MAEGVCMAGGVHGSGCQWQGGVCGWGHAWQGVCMAEGVHGRRDMHGRGWACMAGGHVWQGACMAEGCAWGELGCAWWGVVCMVGGVHAPQTLRDMVGQCVGGTHPTGMHSCNR